MISCGTSDQSKKYITVSIRPQKYLLEKIIGDNDDYNIICLLSPGSNPERAGRQAYVNLAKQAWQK